MVVVVPAVHEIIFLGNLVRLVLAIFEHDFYLHRKFQIIQ